MGNARATVCKQCGQPRCAWINYVLCYDCYLAYESKRQREPRRRKHGSVKRYRSFHQREVQS